MDESQNQMVVFGGFEEGERTNEVVIYNVQKNTWQHVKLSQTAQKPCPRSGHSATMHKNLMYVFGGKSDNSTKLNDFWVFSLSSMNWQQILPIDDIVPEPRSGHTSQLIDNSIVIFGGIQSVTKETNDVYAYCVP